MHQKIIITFSLAVWFATISWKQQGQSLVCASLFSCVESCWYRYHEGRWWTSWQQHYTLTLLSPLIFFSCSMHILLFPLKVWLFEIVAGYYLQLLNNGKNPAWIYYGPNAYCHGNILLSLSMWLRWMALGFFFNTIFNC